MRTFLFIAVVGLMLAVILENVNATGKNSPTKGKPSPDSTNHKKDHKNEHPKYEAELIYEQGKPSPDSPNHEKDHKNEHEKYEAAYFQRKSPNADPKKAASHLVPVTPGKV